MAPIDLISTLVSDELTCRSQRLLARRHKQAQFRDANKQLDNFDFQFNPKMNRSLVFDLAAAGWIGRREDSLFLGPPGSGKSHIAQAIGHAVIQQGYRVLYREAHILLEELADATLDGKRKATHGTAHHRAASHHRRPGNAQAAADRRRGTAGNHHATLRASQFADHVEQTR